MVARPVTRPEVDQTLNHLASEERETRSAFMRKGSAEDGNNPQAQHYVELLRVARENHLTGRSIGMWDVGVYLHTSNPNDLVEGSRALHSVFTGTRNQPQPIRVNVCERHHQDRFEATFTRLNSKEVTVLTCLPKEECPGYEVRQHVSFGSSPASRCSGKVVDVGVILKDGQRTGNWFSVPVSDWARHTLVAGVSGSGKTNTCKSILYQFWHDHSIPWLVLEPSIKSEYRTLIQSSIGADVRVFTLGDETGVPFRLNPLEVLSGIHVQTHIDALLALFNSAFGLVSPMPEVLNLAVHRLYTNFGWDLSTGLKKYSERFSVQPLLRDLLAIVPGLVDELGYNDDISSTIRAGLLTRLSSLLIGAKGLMFNSDHSIPCDFLFSKPTILEMAAVGNEEEKAFLLGAILVRLAQHRQIQGATDGIRVPQLQLHTVLGKAVGLAGIEILRLVLKGRASERIGAVDVPQPELRTVLGNIQELPSMKIMRQALEIVARESGGSVTEDYEDCNGQRTPCLIGLKAPRFSRGIGVDITSEGNVVFRYDEEGGAAAAAKSLCDDVCRVYATVAVLHAQRKLGYRVSTRDIAQPDGRKQVVVSATRD